MASVPEPRDVAFSDFHLHPDLLKALAELEFAAPMPVQAAAIPAALAGNDVLGSAQTGSGKTLAYGLPMLQRLLAEGAAAHGHARPAHPAGPPMPRALVLAPVRELAAQVEETLHKLARHAHLKTALLIGGASMHAQTAKLKAGVDVLVATPGRLLDHLRNTRNFHLRAIKVLVVDEADRMLDMGFLPDVQSILQVANAERQTLMFSATVPPEIERLVRKFMREPERIAIDPTHRPAGGLRQAIYPVSERQKYQLLHALLTHEDMRFALVFTGTKRRADMVYAFLTQKGMSCSVIHSDLPQSRREKTLESFRQQELQVLVATDIAARGLDIRHVSHVINFDPPFTAEDYLHRIGRTGRAFEVGDAITLMTPLEKSAMNSIEAFLKEDIPRLALEGFPYDVPPRLEKHRVSVLDKFRLSRRRFGRAPRRLG